MMHRFWISLTLLVSFVASTVAATAAAGDTTINTSKVLASDEDGNNVPTADDAAMANRRAQSSNNTPYFEISISIDVNASDNFTQICNVPTKLLIHDEINLLLLDIGVGTSDDGQGQICEPDDQIQHVATNVIDPNHTGPWGYIYLGGGPCVHCRLDTSDDRRKLASAAEQLKAAIIAHIETTLLIPNYLSCFGTDPTIQVDVKQVTQSVLNEYCTNTILPTTILFSEWEYERPAWWKTISKEDKNLVRCSKKQYPPVDGSECATKTKSCYWGEQKCASSSGNETLVDYPTTNCECDGRRYKKGTWTCEDVACPV